MRRTFLIGLALIAGLSLSAQKSAKEILERVSETLGASSSFQYEYTYEGWGKTAGVFSGRVAISKKNGMNILVQLNTLDENGKTIKEEHIYTNGNDLKLLDKTDKVLKVGTASGGSGYLMSYIWYAVFREFLIPNAFAMTLEDPTLSLDGSIKVDGIDCYIVSANNQWGDRNSWYFGKEDFQIHGQKQQNSNEATEGGFTFEMRKFKVNEPIDPSVFDISDQGVTISNEDERLIGLGQKAPEWLLKNAAGQNIDSRQLEGKKVVLDFWASWCAPCWKLMPIIDKIKADYEGSNVAVYGVNVWENPKLNVDEYLQKKNLNHYEVLFDREALIAKSFKIAALPLIVVIDEQGSIVFLSNGQDPDLDANIRKLLDDQ